MQFVIVLACLAATVSATYNNGYNNNYVAHNNYGQGGLPQHPQDTYEVAAAKAAHFRAHAEVTAQNGQHQGHVQAYAPQPAQAYAHQSAPVSYGHHGGQSQHPQDTYEVEAAKAAHFRAHAEIAAQNAYAPRSSAPAYQHSAPAYQHSAPAYQHAAPAAYSQGGAPQHPQDTYEVAAAKAAHFRAHAEASAKSSGYGQHSAPAYQHSAPAYQHAAPVAYGQQGQHPQDTYEVAAAKAAHFRAHAEIAAQNGQHGRYRRGVIASPIAYLPHSYGYSSITAHPAPLAYAAHGYALAAPLAYHY